MKIAVLEEKWFHGTPEFNQFGGLFEARTDSTFIVSDPYKWIELNNKLDDVEWNSNEYHSILSEISKLTIPYVYTRPIFFTDSFAVASSYARDDRAFNYQDAEPAVIEVEIDGKPDLSLHLNGNKFNGIPASKLRDGLKGVGLSDDEITRLFVKFLRDPNPQKLKTNVLGAIGSYLDFKIIDLHNIRDSYVGGGKTSTIRMVFDPSIIHIVKDH